MSSDSSFAQRAGDARTILWTTMIWAVVVMAASFGVYLFLTFRVFPLLPRVPWELVAGGLTMCFVLGRGWVRFRRALSCPHCRRCLLNRLTEVASSLKCPECGQSLLTPAASATDTNRPRDGEQPAEAA